MFIYFFHSRIEFPLSIPVVFLVFNIPQTHRSSKPDCGSSHPVNFFGLFITKYTFIEAYLQIPNAFKLIHCVDLIFILKDRNLSVLCFHYELFNFFNYFWRWVFDDQPFCFRMVCLFLWCFCGEVPAPVIFFLASGGWGKLDHGVRWARWIGRIFLDPLLFFLDNCLFLSRYLILYFFHLY